VYYQIFVDAKTARLCFHLYESKDNPQEWYPCFVGDKLKFFSSPGFAEDGRAKLKSGVFMCLFMPTPDDPIVGYSRKRTLEDGSPMPLRFPGKPLVVMRGEDGLTICRTIDKIFPANYDFNKVDGLTQDINRERENSD
jgi:hypothetical protein